MQSQEWRSEDLVWDPEEKHLRLAFEASLAMYGVPDDAMDAKKAQILCREGVERGEVGVRRDLGWSRRGRRQNIIILSHLSKKSFYVSAFR